MIFLYLILVGLTIWLWVVVTNKLDSYVIDKGYESIWWWIFLVPGIGVLYILCMPNKKMMENQEKIIALLGGQPSINVEQPVKVAEEVKKQQAIDDALKF